MAFRYQTSASAWSPWASSRSPFSASAFAVLARAFHQGEGIVQRRQGRRCRARHVQRFGIERMVGPQPDEFADLHAAPDLRQPVFRLAERD
jgi:hypothetical protein